MFSVHYRNWAYIYSNLNWVFKVQFQSLHAVSYSNCFSKSHSGNWSLLHICNTLLIEREVSVQHIIPCMVNNSVLSVISEIDEKDAIICFWNVSIRKIITCKFWNKFRFQNSVNIFEKFCTEIELVWLKGVWRNMRSCSSFCN